MVSNEPSDLSINATFWRRCLTLLEIKLKHRRGLRYSSVLFLSNKRCVKYDARSQLSEAHTMLFIAQYTSIPVPKIHCAFRHKNRTYIVMERMAGDKLAQGWYQRSPDSKAKILSQLRRIMDEMRSIPPPEGTGVASVTGGSLWDCRLPKSEIFGPFPCVAHFHRYLNQGFKYHPENYPRINELLSLHERTWPLCFTHGDLSSLNILVQGDKVTGIIDWETAGWFPSYWEYTTACNVNPGNLFWRDYIDEFLEPMPEELHMEKIRNDYFGDLGMTV